MATSVASLRPSGPIIAIYIQEMGRMLALPHGAAETGPTGSEFLTEGNEGNEEERAKWWGRNGVKCFATPIGPMPGPPPPWGMQKVLWRLRWQTSAPMSPGRQMPTWAFMLAPSM